MTPYTLEVDAADFTYKMATSIIADFGIEWLLNLKRKMYYDSKRIIQ